MQYYVKKGGYHGHVFYTEQQLKSMTKKQIHIVIESLKVDYRDFMSELAGHAYDIY